MMRALLLALFCLAAPAFGQDTEQDTAPVATSISTSPETLVLGEEMTLSFDAPVQDVVFTYRPNSAIPVVDTVHVGGFESIRWTPEQAGVVRVAVPGAPAR